MSEEMKNEKVQETMEDFAAELEASYKEYDERRNQAYVADETPAMSRWYVRPSSRPATAPVSWLPSS